MDNILAFNVENKYYILNTQSVLFYEVNKDVYESVNKILENVKPDNLKESDIFKELKFISDEKADLITLPDIKKTDIRFSKIYVEFGEITGTKSIDKLVTLFNNQYFSENIHLNLFISKIDNLKYFITKLIANKNDLARFSFLLDYHNITKELFDEFPLTLTKSIVIYYKQTDTNFEKFKRKLELIKNDLRSRITIEIDIVANTKIQDLIQDLKSIGFSQVIFSKPEISILNGSKYNGVLDFFGDYIRDYISNFKESKLERIMLKDISFCLELIRISGEKEYVLRKLFSTLFISSKGLILSPFELSNLNPEIGNVEDGVNLELCEKYFNKIIKYFNSLEHLSDIYCYNPLIRFGYNNRKVSLDIKNQNSLFYKTLFHLIIHLHTQVFINFPQIFEENKKNDKEIVYKGFELQLLNP